MREVPELLTRHLSFTGGTEAHPLDLTTASILRRVEVLTGADWAGGPVRVELAPHVATGHDPVLPGVFTEGEGGRLTLSFAGPPLDLRPGVGVLFADGLAGSGTPTVVPVIRQLTAGVFLLATAYWGPAGPADLVSAAAVAPPPADNTLLSETIAPSTTAAADIAGGRVVVPNGPRLWVSTTATDPGDLRVSVELVSYD